MQQFKGGQSCGRDKYACARGLVEQHREEPPELAGVIYLQSQKHQGCLGVVLWLIIFSEMQN